MFVSTWVKRLIFLSCVWWVPLPSISAPLRVDFDSTSYFGIIGPSQIDTSYHESGFRFTPTRDDALVDLSFCSLGSDSCITNNATQYLTALNDAEVNITSSIAFSLTGFDASFFPAPVPPGLFTGVSFGLRLTGELWDGSGTVVQIVTLIEDSNLGDFRFSSYTGAPDLINLRSLALDACWIDGAACVRSGNAFDTAGLQLNDLQFAIDNLTFDIAATVPEPDMLWLVVLSLAALVAARRRSVSRRSVHASLSTTHIKGNQS